MGNKINKQFTSSPLTEYLSGFQYSNQILNFFPTAEGYVKVTVTQTGFYLYNYVYNYLDHLGNVRVSYTKDPADGVLKIIDENHYYPLGLKHNGYTTTPQVLEGRTLPPYVVLTPMTTTDGTYKYEFSGKELQDEGGYNMFDFGARHYDPAIGRWMNIDPLAEHTSSLSPYAYANNNPIYFVDSDGRKSIISTGAHTSQGGNDAAVDNLDMYGRDKYNEDGMYIPPGDRGPIKVDFSRSINEKSDAYKASKGSIEVGPLEGSLDEPPVHLFGNVGGEVLMDFYKQLLKHAKQGDLIFTVIGHGGKGDGHVTNMEPWGGGEMYTADDFDAMMSKRSPAYKAAIEGNKSFVLSLYICWSGTDPEGGMSMAKQLSAKHKTLQLSHLTVEDISDAILMEKLCLWE